MAKKNEKKIAIPKHRIESLARCLLPQMQRYFNSDEGKQAFGKWKAEQTQARGW